MVETIVLGICGALGVCGGIGITMLGIYIARHIARHKLVLSEIII